MEEIIRMEGLTKSFQTQEGLVTALRGIDLSVNRGEIFGIIGLSGAGKSTLVRCINFLERPTSGKVTVCGKEMSQLDRKELLTMRRRIGMIFQGFNLLAQRTALGNVCFPMEISGIRHADAVKRAKELLAMVGLSDREKSYPSMLSGGQKQRVAIARALAMSPEVLLCDEATSALDPTTTSSILSLLKEINRKLGVTVVIITHEMRVIEQICDRVAVIDGGVIAEMGEVKEVFLHPKSHIARQLVLPQGEALPSEMSRRCIRLVFDGRASSEPLLATMILECRTKVNILYAHTKNLDGTAVGQMLLQLPEDEEACDRIRAFLKQKGMSYTEEEAAV